MLLGAGFVDGFDVGEVVFVLELVVVESVFEGCLEGLELGCQVLLFLCYELLELDYLFLV